MLRMIVIAVSLALAMPTLAMAQGNNEHHPPPGKPPSHRPSPGHGPTPNVKPHGPPPGMAGPRPGYVRPGPVGHQFTYRGHQFNRVHIAPFVYPPGWGYRRWGIGMVFPPLFLTPAYFYADWMALGLTPPPPGCQWVRYGPDLVLVNVATGQVLDVVYGAFY